ncbi:MAG: nucleoside hydrolase [Chloroflexi bacterium]|nr:MAG: nucleoside hydrolase [Chloroflexota bacterium]
MTRRIILDCDPGHDDAMAILLAHGTPEVSLAAITTVAGNHPLELTTLNALRVCSLAGIRDVPVAAGCAAPLARPLLTAPEIHGTTGLEGHDWDEPAVRAVAEHAVDVIIEMVMSAPGEITIVPIGPLTNIAMAVRKEPRIAWRAREVVLMGGSYTGGNVTPGAEFNIYVDPEAAAMVFEAGWPVTMVGLEVTRMANASEAVFERIAALNTPVANAVEGMLRFYQRQQQTSVGVNEPPVHDPCAVARVANPGLVPCREARVEVELGDGPTKGMTLVDFRRRDGTQANAMVGTGLEVEGFWDLFIGSLGATPPTPAPARGASAPG